MVRKEGVEPSLREPQSLVLPLHYIGDKWWAIRDSNPGPTGLVLEMRLELTLTMLRYP